jgi:hypothetical protein
MDWHGNAGQCVAVLGVDVAMLAEGHVEIHGLLFFVEYI